MGVLAAYRDVLQRIGLDEPRLSSDLAAVRAGRAPAGGVPTTYSHAAAAQRAVAVSRAAQVDSSRQPDCDSDGQPSGERGSGMSGEGRGRPNGDQKGRDGQVQVRFLCFPLFCALGLP